ncbi:MAG: hypothetical protein PHC50_04520 [Candidatus Cloacimonetes bacterium]|nr:hypothetical protein [Candidatus Cloacimonadota bacterium]
MKKSKQLVYVFTRINGVVKIQKAAHPRGMELNLAFHEALGMPVAKGGQNEVL